MGGDGGGPGHVPQPEGLGDGRCVKGITPPDTPSHPIPIMVFGVYIDAIPPFLLPAYAITTPNPTHSASLSYLLLPVSTTVPRLNVSND